MNAGWIARVAERAVWTFVEGALGVTVVNAWTDINVTLLQGAAVAGLAGVFSVLKTTARERLQALDGNES